VETEGHCTIEKSQTVAIKSKSCIPRRIHNFIVTLYQLSDTQNKTIDEIYYRFLLTYSTSLVLNTTPNFFLPSGCGFDIDK
jgi:hypothetical protein